MQDQLLATLREQLVAIISGTIFVFIGFASCLFAAIRRRSGVRIKIGGDTERIFNAVVRPTGNGQGDVEAERAVVPEIGDARHE